MYKNRCILCTCAGHTHCKSISITCLQMHDIIARLAVISMSFWKGSNEFRCPFIGRIGCAGLSQHAATCYVTGDAALRVTGDCSCRYWQACCLLSALLDQCSCLLKDVRERLAPQKVIVLLSYHYSACILHHPVFTLCAVCLQQSAVF